VCDAPLAERFDRAQVWGSPLPSSLAEGCRQNPGVRQVLKFAVTPEKSACPVAKQIMAFAAPIRADREELLLLFRACSVSAIFCASALEGVRDFVLRAKILGDAVAQNDPALAALAAEVGLG
jgi:hypothetical protein